MFPPSEHARLTADASGAPGGEGAGEGRGRQGAQVIEMQRRRLLLALGEVVAEGGLEAAVVGRICQQAGVSRRTFYELFSDREDCLLAAFDQAIERLAQQLAPVYTRTSGWRQRIRAALALLLEQFDADPDLARLCVVEAPRAGPVLLERRRRVLDALAAAVDEGRTLKGTGAEARASVDPPPLTAQGIVGGVLSVIHTRLLARPGTEAPPVGERTDDAPPDGDAPPLVELVGPLMAMIVLPFLGPAAARKELERPAPPAPRVLPRNGVDPFRGLPIRFTYRTARVLSTIASDPGASNRFIADSSGIADEGQMSRLLRRLHGCGLIENGGEGHTRGEPNAWTLTERGAAIHATIAVKGTS
ncbi:MAG: TetR/AcrR family transcriptional regulator [Solirubrobacteraceae bacterium]